MKQKATTAAVDALLDDALNGHADDLLDLVSRHEGPLLALLELLGGLAAGGISWARSADLGPLRFRIALTVESAGLTLAEAEARCIADDPNEAAAEREAARRFLQATA